MDSPKSTVDIARATLHRLNELGLPPTPQNYFQFYYEISGETPPAPENRDGVKAACPELVKMVRSLLDTISNRTEDLANDIGVRSEEMKQSVDALALAKEKVEMLRLLDSIVGKANEIHGTVEDTRDDLLATRLTLDHIQSELQETRQLLHEDGLTGAQNRRAMDTILAREVSRAQLTGSRLTVAMIDIDHFKSVNDTYGHDAGDKLLLHLTMIAKSVLREADVLVRYGGEEFLLILPDADIRGAEFVVGRLKQVLQKSPLIYEGKKIDVTFSGGIAQIKANENGHALVLRADEALYEAKRSGRNCYKVAEG